MRQLVPRWIGHRGQSAQFISPLLNLLAEFVLLFLAALYFALRPSKKATYERAAHIPLEEDDNDVPA